MYDAVLRVGLPGLSDDASSLLEERYVSRVRKKSPAVANVKDEDDIAPTWTVEAKSIESQLFDSLKSRWQLTFVENEIERRDAGSSGSRNLSNGCMATEDIASCSVNFEVEIQVSNPLISFTLDRVLKDVARKQVEAFEKRCNEVASME
eukprot:CAMPEP_0181124742 /NCGR_PEP_ID=MMETSP1071-20121207/26652_1 /TAXON_ID=35127 /ORGANISM="Thalassiosira sp., Strain NH16" /LENGTH=148 /DNA_ID=CAMNT_0023210085 /DNA_START=294 /DNA_END=740 /DNA_ORIENTATION=+